MFSTNRGAKKKWKIFTFTFRSVHRCTSTRFHIFFLPKMNIQVIFKSHNRKTCTWDFYISQRSEMKKNKKVLFFIILIFRKCDWNLSTESSRSATEETWKLESFKAIFFQHFFRSIAKQFQIRGVVNFKKW